MHCLHQEAQPTAGSSMTAPSSDATPCASCHATPVLFPSFSGVARQVDMDMDALTYMDCM